MRAEPFSFFQTRFDILLVVFLVSLLIISLLIPIAVAPLYGYYTYTLPMMDHEVEYVVADFYNHVIGTSVASGAMRNVTLLEDGSIDVVFAPSPLDIRFQNIPHFEYSRNIKAGQTFVVACIDYEEILDSRKRIFEDARQRLEESRSDVPKQRFEESKQTFEWAKQRLEEWKQKPDSTFIDMVKYTGVKSLERNPAYGFPSDYFEDMYLEHVEQLNGTSTLEFFHFGALLSNRVPCDYPGVIEWSIDVIRTDGREGKEWFPRWVLGLGDVQ